MPIRRCPRRTATSPSAPGSNDYEYVISIEDNGTGISPEHMGAIFEPYRTTKSSGSGLGLLIVRRIIREHGGEISIESEENQGTRVIIHLPRTERTVRLLGAPGSGDRPRLISAFQISNFSFYPHASHPAHRRRRTLHPRRPAQRAGGGVRRLHRRRHQRGADHPEDPSRSSSCSPTCGSAASPEWICWTRRSRCRSRRWPS